MCDDRDVTTIALWTADAAKLRADAEQARRIAVELEQRGGRALELLVTDTTWPTEQQCGCSRCLAIAVLRGEDDA